MTVILESICFRSTYACSDIFMFVRLYYYLLDHLYVNREVCIQINVLDAYFSDHDTVFISLKL